MLASLLLFIAPLLFSGSRAEATLLRMTNLAFRLPFALLPAAFAYAIIYYRAMNISFIVRQGLVYGVVLTVAVTGIPARRRGGKGPPDPHRPDQPGAHHGRARWHSPSSCGPSPRQPAAPSTAASTATGSRSPAACAPSPARILSLLDREAILSRLVTTSPPSFPRGATPLLSAGRQGGGGVEVESGGVEVEGGWARNPYPSTLHSPPSTPTIREDSLV